jgi:hypothetical protein
MRVVIPRSPVIAGLGWIGLRSSRPAFARAGARLSPGGPFVCYRFPGDRAGEPDGSDPSSAAGGFRGRG